MKRSMITLIIGLIGGLLAIIISIVQYIEKENETKKADIEKIKAEKATNELISTQKLLIEKTEEINNMQTGGDSKPFLQISTYQAIQETDAFFYSEFRIFNNGNYPLHYINCSVNDLSSIINYLSGAHKHLPVRSGGASLSVSRDEAIKMTAENKFQFPILLKKNPQHFYTSVFSEKYNQKDSVYYSIEIQWSQASLLYNLTFKVHESKLILDKANVFLDGETVDSSKYLATGTHAN